MGVTSSVNPSPLQSVSRASPCWGGGRSAFPFLRETCTARCHQCRGILEGVGAAITSWSPQWNEDIQRGDGGSRNQRAGVAERGDPRRPFAVEKKANLDPPHSPRHRSPFSLTKGEKKDEIPGKCWLTLSGRGKDDKRWFVFEPFAQGKS